MAMAQALPSDGVMRTADGTPLKVALARAERRERLKALGLVLPLFAFIVLSFLVPIFVMLYNAVYDPDVAENLPTTVVALQQWDGKDLPAEEVFAAFAADMKQAQERQDDGARRQAPELRDLRHPLEGDRHRPQGWHHRGGALQGCRHRHRQDLGRARNLGHHQALVVVLHALLSARHARHAPGRRRLHRAGTGGPRRSISTFSSGRSASRFSSPSAR